MRPFTAAKRLEGGFTFIEVAFMLPIFLMLIFAAAYFYKYVRILGAVTEATSLAYDITTGETIYDDQGRDYLKWQHEEGGTDNSSPFRPSMSLRNLNCAASQNPTACYAGMLSGGSLKHLVWSGYGSDPGEALPDSAQALRLPFSLTSRNYGSARFFSATATDGYSPVMFHPVVGIENGCLEPHTEAGTRMDSNWYNPSTPGRGVTLPGRDYALAGLNFSPHYCNTVRPIYWHSPHRADFDGDGREDFVAFRASGNEAGTEGVNPWGSNALPGEIDFVVWLSGSGYSAANGLLTFNLTTEPPTPAWQRPIPILEDFDNDGLTDFAVLEPATMTYRIALSSTNYTVIVIDKMQNPFLSEKVGIRVVAFAGQFRKHGIKDIVVIPFSAYGAGTTGNDNRYNIYYASPFEGASGQYANPLEGIMDDIGTDRGTKITFPVILEGSSNSDVKTISSDLVKPPAATASVPAPADIDGDGIVELGYLSWYGGNLTKRVAGLVPDAGRTLDGPLGDCEYNAFPGEDSPGCPSKEGAFGARMNPFSIDTDPEGNLYYLDSVDGRVWKVSRSENAELGEFKSSSVEVVVKSHATRAARTPEDGTEVQDLFPRENIMNLVRDKFILSAADEAEETTAGKVQLNSPRKLAISKTGRHMYIADWGNGRIIRVDESAGGFTKSSSASVILGSATCLTDPDSCVDPLAVTTGPGVSANWDGEDGLLDGRYRIWPSAIETVSLHSTDYIFFSSGSAIYLLTNANRNPSSRKLFRVAGSGRKPSLMRRSDAGLYGENQVLVQPTNAAVSNSAHICPVNDLLWDEDKFKLYAAISCGTTATPYDNIRLNVDRHAVDRIIFNVGGIVLIESNKLDNLPITDQNNSLSLLIGGFQAAPCHDLNKNCYNSTRASEMNKYHEVNKRKIDILNPDPTKVDLINPVDLEFDAAGNLLFINQWNDGSFLSDSLESKLVDLRTPAAGYYLPSGDFVQTAEAPFAATARLLKGRLQPNFEDNLYRYDSIAKQIIPVTSILQTGDGVIPYRSHHWHSPHRYESAAGSGIRNTIPAHEAPISTQPVAARGGIAVHNGLIYLSTPFLNNPYGFYTVDGDRYDFNLHPEHPFKVDYREIGAIYRIIADIDGDGIPDHEDENPDGDSISGLNESSIPGRSAFVPELGKLDVPTNAIRAQELLSLPRMFFFRLTQNPEGSPLAKINLEIPAPQGFTNTLLNNAPSDANYIEYLLLNSVGECGPSYSLRSTEEACYEGANSYPEPWANLLLYGTANDYDQEDKSLDDISRRFANGPIAAPTPRRAFSGARAVNGLDWLHYPSVPYLNVTSPLEQQVPALTVSDFAGKGEKYIDRMLFKLPVVLSSTHPKENGIKPLAFPLHLERGHYGQGSPIINTNGALCTLMGGGYYSPVHAPFGWNFSDYLTFSAISESLVDRAGFSQKQNNALGFYARCEKQFTSTYGRRKIASEGAILQLMHDDNNLKESMNFFEAASPDGRWVHYWPAPAFAGDPRLKNENQHMFLFADFDGDGLRTPVWIQSEAFSNPSDIENKDALVKVAAGSLLNCIGNPGGACEEPTYRYRDDTFDSHRLDLQICRQREPFAIVESNARATQCGNPQIIELAGYSRAPMRVWAGTNNGPSSGFHASEQTDFRQSTGLSQERYYTTSMIFDLNREPFFNNSISRTAIKNVGAGLYSNYTTNQRFGTENVKAAGLRAAGNLLRINFDMAEQDIFEGEANLNPGQAQVTFVDSNNNPECNKQGLSQDGLEPCSGIKVAYAFKIFGRKVTIEKTREIPETLLKQLYGYSDPEKE